MLFNIWSPMATAPDEVTFDVTQANAPRVGNGDPDWIAACLDAIGISLPASEWSVQATRCHFYSDYPDEEEWSDRWPETWIVQVTLEDEAPEDFGRPDGSPEQVNQYDETWNYGDFDSDHDRTALLLAFVEGRHEEAIAVRDDLSSQVPGDYEVELARVDTVDPDLHQVRILVRGELFPDRVESIERVLQQAEDRGHVVNRYDVFEA
jgi:hypothetical protein